MSGRTRNVQIPFRVTAEEKDLIEKNVSQLGTQNLSAYLRKMAINGYILHLDLPELPQMLSLLRNMSNNLNQLTKRVNASGNLYEGELTEISTQMSNLWEAMNLLLKRLANLEGGKL